MYNEFLLFRAYLNCLEADNPWILNYLRHIWNCKILFMFLKAEFWWIFKNCHQFLGFIRESVLKPPSALPYNFTAEDVRWVNACSAKSSGKTAYSFIQTPKYLHKTINLHFVLCGIVSFIFFASNLS